MNAAGSGALARVAEDERRGERSEIELSGFSGARVLLVREGSAAAFIRKISATPAGNARLQAQAVKQRLTAGLLDGCATTPRILGEAVDGAGRYSFDMDYVRGLDGVTFLRTASFPAIVRFTDALCDSLRRFASLADPLLRVSPRAAALAKCEEILVKVAGVDARAGRCLERLIGVLSLAEMPDELAATACHGDMTLENIVVTAANEIVFIDLLDSFFDHWLGDVAKLDQDLKAGWYMRKSPALPLGVVHYLRGRLAGLSAGTAGLLFLIVCVHLARILPYAKTAAERGFVLDRLEALLAGGEAAATRKGFSP